MMSAKHSPSDIFPFPVSWKDIGGMGIILVILNFLDVVLTFYAINTLGFVELNHLAIGFPLWIFITKFGGCFVPFVCAYMLHKVEMEHYLLLPFICSLFLIEFYALVIALNVYTIFGA
jgi:hypothetical protein